MRTCRIERFVFTLPSFTLPRAADQDEIRLALFRFLTYGREKNEFKVVYSWMQVFMAFSKGWGCDCVCVRAPVGMLALTASWFRGGRNDNSKQNNK